LGVHLSREVTPLPVLRAIVLSAAALAGAAFYLSAARIPRVAAAVAEIPNLPPVIPKQEVHLGGPGKRGLEVGEKIPDMGPAPFHDSL
jgi:hypothetical protein